MQQLAFDVPDDKIAQFRAVAAVLLQTPEERAARTERAKADYLAGMTPERRAEYDRFMSLAPEARRAEVLLKQKLAVEKQLRSEPVASVLADAEALSRLAPEAAEEARGFLLRGTVVKE